MANKRREDPPLFNSVDDDMYDELMELVGQGVVHMIVWDESLLDALEESEDDPDSRQLFDLDLYLDEGIYFELYATACHEDPALDPLSGHGTVEYKMRSLVNQGLQVVDVAVDEEDRLILILGRAATPLVYLSVSGWTVEDWDELPAKSR